MNFEKALEAMKQGKKAGRRAWADWDKSKMIFLKGDYFYWVGEEDIGVALTLDFLEADDWEIYEEPQKEPEMATEKACKILDLILDYINVGEFEYITHCSFSEIAESVRLAIEALENQNQPEPEKKCECKCKMHPAKWFSDDIQKVASDMFTAGLKFGLEIAKDLQEENKNNA